MNKQYTIEARRWLDRINGNTYHSVRVKENGITIGTVNFTYGYGEHYKQTALDLLHKAGLALEFNMLWKFAESIGRENVQCFVSDTNKRDLKFT